MYKSKILCIIFALLLASTFLFLIGSCGKEEESKPTGPTGVIGKTTVPIDTRMIYTRTQETAIGNLIADAMFEKYKSQGVKLAFMNGGGIRAGSFPFATKEAEIGKVYPAGDITEAMVKEWLPFGNTDCTLSINGKQLKTMLERSVSALPPDLANDEGGWFLDISGGKYWVDCTKTAQVYDKQTDSYTTPGQRITKIMVDTVVIYDVTTGWKNGDSTATTYKIAINSYISAGNDGYPVLKEVANTKVDTGINPQITVTDYIKAHTPITPVVDTNNRRITITGGCDHAATNP